MYLIGSIVCGPVGLVCWIMYWVKIAGYTRMLQETGREPYEGEDDDYDDRPRKRRVAST